MYRLLQSKVTKYKYKYVCSILEYIVFDIYIYIYIYIYLYIYIYVWYV